MSHVDVTRQFDLWSIVDPEEDFIDGDDDDDEGEIHHLSECSNSEPEENGCEATENGYKALYLDQDETTSWSKKPYSPKFSPKTEITSGDRPKVKSTAKDAMTPLDTWKLFVDDRMLKDILKYTNSKIRLKTAYYDADQRYNQVGQTTIAEIKAVLGLLYFAGIFHSNRQSLEDLWSANGTGMEIFRLTMSFFRFTFLISFISFDELDRRADKKRNDKLAQIREIFERFVKNCQNAYSPGEFLTLTQRFQRFKGPCPFGQWTPHSPTKCGIKIFTLIDVRVYYVLNMEIYCRQPEGLGKLSYEPGDVVDRLVAPISQSERNITLDKKFARYEIMLDLLKNHKLTSVGSLNGKHASEIYGHFLRANLEKNSSIFGFREDISMVDYARESKKRVLVLSTLHREDSVDENGKPSMVDFYDCTENSMKVFEQIWMTHDVSRNSRRWPLAVFFAMLNVAGINSQIIFKMNTNNLEKKRKTFLQDLAHELVREHLQNRKKNQRVPREIRQKIAKYFGDPVEAYRKRRNVHGRCAICPREKDRKSFYGCAGCHRYICMGHAIFYCEDCCGARDED